MSSNIIIANTIQNQYHPDVHSAPGETLLETIAALNISPADLAQQLGQAEDTITAIIQGESRLTPEIALQLERVLGIPTSFWNNYEQNYRQSLERQAQQQRLRTRKARPVTMPS